MVRFEHFALNVRRPHEIADWYVRTLGCRIVSQLDTPPFTVFLADPQGRVFAELYENPQAPYSDVCQCDPLVFHVALAVDDAAAMQETILAAGGSYVTTVRTDSGSVLVMMRDPFGIALQLCQRVPPLLR
jgi:catechol 2,3-dioxygenase-like lactoylglutathione lyase family enzyme